MQTFFLNAQVCIYSLADLIIGHWVEMTFIGACICKKCYIDYRRKLHSIKSERFEGVYWKHR